ncbi:MAG: MerR family transcriptional regulator, partial [Actinomycetota bacterium]|nr:MerR family transcriptional regulator [Actinomycetota bacterium]
MPETPARSDAGRRRAALAGHTGDAAAARSLLDDPSPAVRATALAALGRLGAVGTDDLGAALADPSPEVRRRACRVAIPAADVDLAPLLHDPDAGVVEVAAWALGERG